MRCLFFMCSESTAIDAPTGRLNVFHVIEELTAASFPVLVSQLHMVAMLERSAQDPAHVTATASVTLDGTQVGGDMSLSIDFKDHERTKVVANIQGVVLPKPGKVRVLLKVQNTVLGVWEMQLRFVQQNQASIPQIQAGTAKPAPAETSSATEEPAVKPDSDAQNGEKLKKPQRK